MKIRMKIIENVNAGKCYMQHEVILTNPVGMVRLYLRKKEWSFNKRSDVIYNYP